MYKTVLFDEYKVIEMLICYRQIKEKNLLNDNKKKKKEENIIQI